MSKILYNTINHNLRNSLGLKLNEYVLLDSINQLQQDTGWCWASKEYLVNIIDTKERALKDLLDSLISRGWINRKDNTNRYLKVTNMWIEPFNGIKQNVAIPATIVAENTNKPAESANKVAETADNNNIYINNIYNILQKHKSTY